MTDKMKKPLIEAKNVSVILNYELILQNVNLEVFKGDTIVLIGPSGSGKTVLLKTLAGIYPPAEGYVKCHDLKWADMSLQVRHDFAKVLGMQFQKGALFDDLSTIDNLKYVLREHTTLSEPEIETRSLECLRMVNLEHARNLAPHELSGGMKLRLGVARALVLRPEIIFLDDPTAGLDPVSSDEMAKLILDIKQQIQATMVIVTHDISRAYQFAGRIFLVAGKTLFETGSASQTQNNSDPRIQQFLHGWIKGPLTENIES
jgi:phospholipid/cholesterol/gamma-HCH transport system ATP-binding protein